MWSPYEILVGLELIIYIGSSWVGQLSVTITKPQENQLIKRNSLFSVTVLGLLVHNQLALWEHILVRVVSQAKLPTLLIGSKQKMRKGLGSYYFLQGHISNELKASHLLILPKGFNVTWVFGGLEDANYSRSWSPSPSTNALHLEKIHNSFVHSPVYEYFEYLLFPGVCTIVLLT